MSEDVKVEMGGETTGFRRAVQEMVQSAKDGTRAVESQFGGLSRVFDGVRGHIAALGIAVSAGSFFALIKGSIDAADNLNDLAQRTGMSVEVLSGLKLVADQSGTSLEGLGGAFKKLSVNLVDASVGNKEMSAIFKGLGISGTNAQEAMYRLADIMKTLPDGAQKTALAVKLLGKAGEEMIPLLNQGGAELRKMIEHGQKLSGVTSDMAHEADQFNDQMAELKTQTSGLAVSMTKFALPALNDIAAAMIRAQKESGTLAALFTGLGGAVVAAFGGATNPIDMASARANKLFQELFKAQQKLRELQTTKAEGGIAGFLIRDEDIERQKRYIDDVKARMSGALAARDALLGAPKPADKPDDGGGDNAESQVCRAMGGYWNAKTKKCESGAKAASGNKSQMPDSYMSTYEAKLAVDKNEYEQENANRQFSKQQELAYWNELLASYQVTSNDRKAIAKRTATLELEIRRDAAKQQLELDAVSVEQAQATAESKVAMDQARAQAELDNGLTTKEQYLEQEEQFEARRYEIALTALAQRIALAEKDPTRSPAEIAKLYAEVDQLDTQHQIKRIQIASKAAQESGSIWKNLNDRMSNLWDKGMQALLNGTLTWRNGLRAVGAEVVSWFATDVVGKQIKIWLFGETTKTGATQTGTATRLAIEAGAALKSVGIWAMTAVKNIMASAWEAMAAAWKAVVGIPVVGPVLAPVAAGAAFAGVSKLAKNVMSAEGGYDIPRGINPLTQLHEQEMVLPAKHADVIRGLAESGDTKHVANNYVTMNIQTRDADSFRASHDQISADLLSRLNALTRGV